MIRLAKRYLSPYLRQTLLLLTALLASAVFNLMLPTVGKQIVNEGVANQDTAYIFRLGLQMVVFLLLALGLMLVVNRLSAQVAMGFSRDLRHALFQHIGTLSQRELDELSTATLISCQVNDVNQVQTVLMNVLNIFLSAPLMAVGGAVMAYITAPNLSWILLAILPPCADYDCGDPAAGESAFSGEPGPAGSGERACQGSPERDAGRACLQQRGTGEKTHQ